MIREASSGRKNDSPRPTPRFFLFITVATDALDFFSSLLGRASLCPIPLRESYRENGKVRKRTLCNLSDLSVAHIEGLRGVLRGGAVIAADRDAFTVTRSLLHGHAALALGTARNIGLDAILGPEGNRCRDLALALIVARIIDRVEAGRRAGAFARHRRFKPGNHRGSGRSR
jgi:hypothetical protein